MFSPIDDYIDFSDEWWKDVKEANDQFVINGKHYVMTLEVSADVIMLYNKQVIAQNGLKDPLDYYKEGNWTWNTCKDLMVKFITNNGDGYYGIDGWWVTKGFANSTGVPFIGMSNGKVSNNFQNPDIAAAEEFCGDLNKENIMYPVWNDGWQSDGTRVGEGKVLFYPVGSWTLMSLDGAYAIKSYTDDVNNLGFVPFPRYQNADEYYVPARIAGYFLCSGAKNPKGVACLAYCERAGAMSEEGAMIAKAQYMNEYGWTEEMWDLYRDIGDLANAHPVFDFVGGITGDSAISQNIDNNIKGPIHSGASWSQTVGEMYGEVQSVVDELNNAIE